MNSDLLERVGGALQSLVPPHSKILVGLSGGVDSVVLLHLLAQLAPRHSWQLSALHVHHGISPHADAWAAFCTGLCAQHGIPVQVQRVDIAPLRAMGVEAAARELRHAALKRQPADFIALAHHQDDQAETLLLQLLRGAGVKGAAAMPLIKHVAKLTPSPLTGEGWGEGESATFPPSPQPSPARGEGVLPRPSLLRPLLNISRTELLAYAQQHALQWVEDDSNSDERYPRNFLRHRVLPLLEQRFPSARATLARSAQHFAEAAHLLDVLAGQDAQDAYNGATLAVARLAELEPVRAKNLLRWFIQQRGARLPDHTRLEEMLRQLRQAQANAQLCIAWEGWELRRYRGRAYVERGLATPDAGWCVPWNGEEELELPQLGGVLRSVRCEGGGLSLKKLAAAPLTLRLRSGEEQLRPHADRPARTLQYLFLEHDVPPWQRGRWPLLYCGERLVAVAGLAVAAEFRAEAGEAGVQLDWTGSAHQPM